MHDALPVTPLWLRIVRHPAARLQVLGSLIFYTMGFSNRFMGELEASPPLVAIAAAAGMVVLGLVMYAGFVR